LDFGGLTFFIAAFLLFGLDNAWFAEWGSVTASLGLGVFWLATLSTQHGPLTAEYSKWKFIEPLWRNGTFIYINAAITLAWGWQFVLAGLLGIVALLLPEFRVWLNTGRYLIVVPAALFTLAYQKGAERRRIENIEQGLARIRIVGWTGILFAVVLLIFTLSAS
jgi:hypothetical protein